MERSPKSLKNLVTLCDLGLLLPGLPTKPTLVHQDPGHRNESQGENLRERHLGDFYFGEFSHHFSHDETIFFWDSDSDVDFVER